MVVGGAVESLSRLALHRPVSEGVHDVVHGGKLTLPSPLSALPQFVPVMLDLRLVSERHLQEHMMGMSGQIEKVHMASSEGGICSMIVSPLC